MDNISPQRRSALMSHVRSSDTTPEIEVRKIVWSLGFRYRLHSRQVPGSPDLVFPGRKKVIFVHGCFWHAHEGCSRARLPKTRPEFWQAKREQNKQRDLKVEAALLAQGWNALIVWQCELRDSTIRDKIAAFLQVGP